MSEKFIMAESSENQPNMLKEEKKKDVVERKKEDVDFSKISVGMKIKIKQPELPGVKEHWIESQITSVNMIPDDLFVVTEDSVYDSALDSGSSTNEFGPNYLWTENGVLFADPHDERSW
jgi:hypothetical protein